MPYRKKLKSLGRSLKILHLEDNHLDAELIAHLLRSTDLPIQIVHASSPEGYIQALDREQFDLILCDYSIPGYDGLEALAACRKWDDAVPFIFLSGTIGEERAVESLKLGATDYILKDHPDRLLSAILRALDEADQERERRRLEEALRRSEERFRHIAENAKDVIYSFFFSPSPHFDFISPALLNITGQNPEEYYSDPGLTSKSILPEDLPTLKQILEQRIIPEKPIILRWIGKDGRIIWTEHTISGIYTEGRLVGFEGIGRDMTEQKKMEAQLLRAQRLECVGSLAGGLAHDLNNVLAPVLMAAEMLRSEDSISNLPNWADILESSARRGADLIQQILAFTRGSESEAADVDAGRAIREVQKVLKATFPSGIKLSTQVPKNLWLVRGNFTELHQILMNLCINARDAMPGSGTISITARNKTETTPGVERKEPWVEIEVKDNGTGMPPEVLKRIFEPFFTTKPVGKGTGLGLATVQKILQKYRGRIRVESEPGQGTTFFISFPAMLEQRAVAEQKKVELPGGSGERILLVEDEAALREMVKTTLEDYGYHVIAAANGAEALTLFKENKGEFNLVVTDLGLPLMNGITLAQELLKRERTLPLLVMSGSLERRRYEDIPTRRKRLIPKPFSTAVLICQVNEMLTSPEEGF